MTSCQIIIIGAGGVGSAAAYHLAQRGASVLAIDRFTPGHDRGSSHGQTRVIRKAYCEHPDYVPLLEQSYRLWSELQQKHGKQLYYEVGLLQVGPGDGYVLPGVFASARQHSLEVEALGRAETMQRFPGFNVPEGCEAVLERKAGYLLVEEAVKAHWRLAEHHGAQLVVGETVQRWEVGRSEVVVETDRRRYRAERLIIAAGAWAAQLLSDLQMPLQVRRKHLYWFENRDKRYLQEQHCPVYLFELSDGIYYGFPQRDELGVKCARHSGGQPVPEPLSVSREIDSSDQAQVERFLELCLPAVRRRLSAHTVCLYTMSPDEHFVVDRHPNYPQVAFAAGLSGHGFKFTPVLGSILADLALEGATEQSIEFLRCSRSTIGQR